MLVNVSISTFNEAHTFVKDQTQGMLPIELVGARSGFLTTRRPVCLVTVPKTRTANFVHSVCCLFHEYGHWLDMQLWLEKKTTRWDSIDRRVSSCLQRCEKLSSTELNEYLERRSLEDERMTAYNKNLMNRGIVQGVKPLRKYAVLRHERKAWVLGCKGTMIRGGNYYGMIKFLRQSDEIVEKEEFLKFYHHFATKMVKSYADKFRSETSAVKELVPGDMS